MKNKKQEYRRQLREQRNAMPVSLRAEYDAAIGKQVRHMAEWRRAKTIFIYVSVGSEPNTHVLIQRALDEGKRVVVPRCVPHSPGEMQLCLLQGLDELRPAAFGLLEPWDACETVSPPEVDFAVVPCITCDPQCNRLGQGGGYYDRILENKRFPAAALVYEALLLPQVPCEAWDVPVDYVVTEQQIYVK